MLLLSTSSLKWYGLHKIFLFAKKVWYSGIDLYMDEKNFDHWDKEYIKNLVDTFDIPVLSVTASERGINKKVVDKIVDISTHIWAQCITFSPPRLTDKNPEWFTKYLSKVSKDNHIVITAKNVEAKMLFFIIPEYRNSNLAEIKKVTGYTSLDLSNIDKSTWMDILKAQTILAWSIKNIYFSDKRWPKWGLLPWKAGWWISHLPLESFLMKLKTTSYSGYITLEVSPSELEVWDNSKVIENLEYVKSYYEKHFLNYR